LKKSILLLVAAILLLSLTACFFGGNEYSEYSVTFNPNYDVYSGVINTVFVVSSGEIIDEPLPPERDQYEFTFWSTDEYGEFEFDFSTPITEDLELFAQWKRRSFTVSFYRNDGTDEMQREPIIVEDGESIGVPISSPPPRRERYNFSHWTLDPDGEQWFYTGTPITEDLSLYAQWWSTAPLGGVLNGRWVLDSGGGAEVSINFEHDSFTMVGWEIRTHNAVTELSTQRFSPEWVPQSSWVDQARRIGEDQMDSNTMEYSYRRTTEGTFSFSGDRIEMLFVDSSVIVEHFSHTRNTFNIRGTRFIRYER